jgi:putative ABC transport system permease protein
MMRGVFWLSRKDLLHRPIQSALLAICLALPIFLPLATKLLLDRYQDDLLSRAEATPLIAGGAGNRFDLTLSSLYFRSSDLKPIPMSEMEAINRSGLAYGIPLRLGNFARGHPIVATSPEYFELRRLQPATGALPLRLGEVVLGSAVALELDLGVGDSLFSDPRRLYDISVPPSLKMRVCGTLKPMGTADDRAVFVDLGTAWILEGYYHGHGDAQSLDPSLILEKNEDLTRVSGALVEYNEVTAENQASFHYHGDRGALPLSGLIVVPEDAKGGTLMKARMNTAGAYQMLVPTEVVNDLLKFVFRIKTFLDGYALILLCITSALLCLILWLTSRLRRREMETLHRIGVSRGTVAALHVSGFFLILLASAALAGLALVALHLLLPDLVRWLR